MRRLAWSAGSIGDESSSHAACEFGLALGEHFLMQRAAVGVHGDNDGEIAHFELPDGFGGSEFFEQVDIVHADDPFGEHLSGPPDGVEVDATVLLAGAEGAVAHTALSDDAAEFEIANDVALVRFLTDGSGGTCCGDFPGTRSILEDDGSAVVDDPVREIDSGGEFPSFVEVFMDGVSTGKDDAGDGHRIAYFEGSDFIFGEGRGERDHNWREVEGGVAGTCGVEEASRAS